MSKAYAVDADFSGADFTNSVLDRVIFDRSRSVNKTSPHHSLRPSPEFPSQATGSVPSCSWIVVRLVPTATLPPEPLSLMFGSP